ncbi:MAG TPA: hypothetical protein VMT85_07780 [Thermoanaerobaculia bacterium]|nr:hypothetical protein [Thermoanaerobaculia bacterium]
MNARSRNLGGAAALLAVLALATVAWDLVRARDLPTASAEWIWAGGVETGKPLAFVAAVDFDLEEVPARAEARLLVDPEYELYLNGTWIGAGAWELGEPLDVWEVADRLQPGPNRLAIVARAPYGVGGLLAALIADPGAPAEQTLAASGTSWRIYGRRPAGILEGWSSLDASHAESSQPVVWGAPPIGRWGRPQLGSVRAAEEPAVVEVWGREVSPVPGAESERRAWLVDFGEVAVGWIDLWGGPTPETRARWRAAETLAGLAGAAPSGWVVPLRADDRWRSPAPRRLRYLWIDSPEPPRAARILGSEPEIPLDTPSDDERRERDGLWRFEPSGAEPR